MGRQPEPQEDPGSQTSDAELDTAGPGASPLGMRQLPPRLGPYELEDEVGRGGMGVVYRARHRGLGKPVAVKVLDPRTAEDVARFQIEARAMAGLAHPHVVEVHDVGREAGYWYLVMDWIPGGTLAALIATAGPCSGASSVSLLRRLQLVATVARAVQHAHEQGIVHRDLKPSNILLDGEGRPLVTDFGLASQRDTPQGLTRSGEILGTPAYMAPEQARGEREAVGAQSDVYALGAILYELLTGQRPHSTSGRLEADLVRVIHEAPRAPRKICPAIPKAIETVVMCALAKRPADRYASAAALADDLEGFVAGRPVQARPLPLRTRTLRWLRRHPAGASAGLLAVLALVVLALFAREKSREQQPWHELTGSSGAAWEATAGSWEPDGEGWLAASEREAVLVYGAPASGNVRVSFVGRMLATGGSDLSVLLLSDAQGTFSEGYFVGFGSSGNQVAKILRRGQLVAFRGGVRIEPGRDYTVVVERTDGLVRLLVDGSELLAYHDPLPLSGGDAPRVALYCWDTRARFSDVHAYVQKLPERTGPLELAARLQERGHPGAALELYQEALATSPAGPEALDLQLRAGYAALADGRLGQARQRFELAIAGGPGSRYAAHAELALARLELRAGDPQAALERALAVESRYPASAAASELLGFLATADAELAAGGRHAERLPILAAELIRARGFSIFAVETRLRAVSSLTALGHIAEAESTLVGAFGEGAPPELVDFDLWMDLASLRLRAGRAEAGLEALAQAESLAVSSPRRQADLAERRAELLLRLGRDAEAWRAVADGLELTSAHRLDDAVFRCLSARLALAAAGPQSQAAGEPLQRLAALAREGVSARAPAARFGGALAAIELACWHFAREELRRAESVLQPWCEAPVGHAGFPEHTILLLTALLQLRLDGPQAARQNLEHLRGRAAPRPLLGVLAEELLAPAMDGSRRSELLASPACADTRVWVRFALAQRALSLGKTAEARQLLEAALQACPDQDCLTRLIEAELARVGD